MIPKFIKKIVARSIMSMIDKRIEDYRKIQYDSADNRFMVYQHKIITLYDLKTDIIEKFGLKTSEK